MLSTSHVVNQPKPIQSQGTGQKGTPETGGEFDFMNYFLGLQASLMPGMQESGTEIAANPTTVNKPSEDDQAGKDALLNLLSGKKGQNGNPLASLMASQTVALAPQPRELPSQSSNSQNLSDGLLRDANPFGSPMMAIENRTTQLPSETTDVTRLTQNQSVGMVRSGAPGMDFNRVQQEAGLQKYAAQMKAGPETGEPLDARAVGTVYTATPRPSVTPKIETEGSKRSLTDELRPTTQVQTNPINPWMGAGNNLGIEKATAAMNASEVKSTSDAVSGRDSDGKSGVNVSEMFQRVESMVNQGGGKMTFSLSPPDLGQVQVQVTTRGKKVEIEIQSEKASTKSVLESGLADLKLSMHAQDLVLSKVDVQVGKDMNLNPNFSQSQFASLSGQGQSFAQSQHSQNFQGSSSSHRFQNGGNGQIPAARAVASTRPNSAQAGTGRVDIRI